jgi:hypothetical protein
VPDGAKFLCPHLGKNSIGTNTERERRSSSMRAQLIPREREVGATVLIDVRCIAAIRAAGTVYESINQSINEDEIAGGLKRYN